ncbi:hypothetical protein [Marinomonas sp. 2405UD68-3]|uniref:hypothetical protein n=1 Tax=Marinomonas sp. 2405UD68-3 TaxID=3391835 RepID=UPI0039C97A3A
MSEKKIDGFLGGRAPKSSFSNKPKTSSFHTLKDLNDETIKKPITRLVIPASELEERTVCAKNNTRLFVGQEFTDFGVYKDLRDKQIMTQPASGYRVTGNDKIFLSNGKSRRAMIMELHKNHGIDIDFIVDVVDIQHDQMWIADRLRDDSDSNRKLNWLEDALRVKLFYEEQVIELGSKTSLTDFNVSYAKKISGRRYNNKKIRSQLIISLIWTKLENIFLKVMKASDELTQNEAIALEKYMESFSGNSIDISVHEGRNTFIKKSLQDEIFLLWEEPISEIQKKIERNECLDLKTLLKSLAEETKSNTKKVQPTITINNKLIKGQYNFKIERNSLNHEQQLRAEALAKTIDNAVIELNKLTQEASADEE